MVGTHPRLEREPVVVRHVDPLPLHLGVILQLPLRVVPDRAVLRFVPGQLGQLNLHGIVGACVTDELGIRPDIPPVAAVRLVGVVGTGNNSGGIRPDLIADLHGETQVLLQHGQAAAGETANLGRVG
jgi:hypothetical protein